MDKERQVNRTAVTVFINEETNSSILNQLFHDFQGDIIICGDLILNEENFSIQCDNLYVMGRLNGANISVRGNLYVEDYVDCGNININGCMCCNGYVDAFNIDVAEDLYVKKYIETYRYDINVGGEFVCDGAIDASKIIVLNRMQVAGQIKSDNITVGYS